MLKIRLRRTGARKKPSYRIVVAESTAPRDGKYVEIIGTYDPLTDPATIKLDGDRAQHWLSVGAQPTERVVKLMAREGLVEAPTYPAPAPKKSDDGAKAEAAPATTAAPAEAAPVDAETPAEATAAPVTPAEPPPAEAASDLTEAPAETTDAEPAATEAPAPRRRRTAKADAAEAIDAKEAVDAEEKAAAE